MKKVFLFLFSILLVFCFLACKQRQRPGNYVFGSQPASFNDDHIFDSLEYKIFELPINGATGYAAVDLPLYKTTNESESENVVFTLSAGQGFTLLGEMNDWWYIEVSDVRGWVLHEFCLINLPDIIPSIVYNNTNTFSSLFRSSGFDIPNITGMALYEGKDFNTRLGRDEYFSPVLYSMAPKVFAAQQSALAEGNTLVIYEAFRPAEAHDLLHEHFSNLVDTNPVVHAGITADSFNIRWFLAEAPYNHQRGTAIDTSLAVIDRWQYRNSGKYQYMFITECTEYYMQSPMHELSVASAVFDSTVYARSTTSWIGAEHSENVTHGTILLQGYCTDAGLTPLASEWWHFNDLISTVTAIDMENEGRYHIERTYSKPPERP